MEREEFLMRKAHAIVTGTLDRYVVLKEDADGRYIEYAFQEGAPEDNRCLSWYDKLQPAALARNDHKQEEWKLHEVDKIYELHLFSCGDEDKEGDEHCSAGHPKKRCLEMVCKNWTYDEPVKCACWFLADLPDLSKMTLPFNLINRYCETMSKLKGAKYSFWERPTEVCRVGDKVCRMPGFTRRKFKSGFEVNTIKAVIHHPYILDRETELGVPAYEFYEDDSIVEASECVRVPEDGKEGV